MVQNSLFHSHIKKETSVKNILLVDDDDGFRESVRETLSLSGYEVHEVNNGADALKCLKTMNIDLLITDILMPELEGIELSSLVRDINPDLHMIGMSGGGRIGFDYVKKASNTHFNSFLAKPFQREELLNEIKKYITE